MSGDQGYVRDSDDELSDAQLAEFLASKVISPAGDRLERPTQSEAGPRVGTDVVGDALTGSEATTGVVQQAMHAQPLPLSQPAAEQTLSRRAVDVGTGASAGTSAADAGPASGPEQRVAADKVVETAPASSAASASRQAGVHGSHTVEFVDTVERCQAVCQKLLQQDTVAVDVEGVKLGRNGEICILQVADKDKQVYLFDITILRNAAFQHGLTELLGSESVIKLFYDCRCDCDALYHVHKVKLRNMLDMQVLCQRAKGGDSMFLFGLAKALAFILPPQQVQAMQKVKSAGVALFAPDRGGTFEVWKARPLPNVLITYCAQDVVHMFTMLRLWGHHVSTHTLRLVSEQRMLKRILSSVVETGPQLARKDFKFPDEDVVPKAPRLVKLNRYKLGPPPKRHRP